IAFFGMGAYTAGILIVKLGWPWLWASLAGGVGAVVLALVIGWPCLRLKGPYFATAMLGLNEVLRVAVSYFESLTGGGSGLSLPALYASVPIYYAMRVVALAVPGRASAIVTSRFGLRLMTIREDEVAAESMGIDTFRYKLYAFLLSAVGPGIVGRSEEHPSELQSHRDLRPSPTRRSSDLPYARTKWPRSPWASTPSATSSMPSSSPPSALASWADRKSTPLNSSPTAISALPLHAALPIYHTRGRSGRGVHGHRHLPLQALCLPPLRRRPWHRGRSRRARPELHRAHLRLSPHHDHHHDCHGALRRERDDLGAGTGRGAPLHPAGDDLGALHL